MIAENESNKEGAVFLITGSDTGVGKTVFTGLLGRYLGDLRIGLRLAKPFCSGGMEDVDFLVSCGAHGKAEVNFWYDDEPVSPAAWELSTGGHINFDNIIERLRQVLKRDDCDILLIEGVGGLLAPIAQKHTVASMGKELGSNLIIVAQNRVGVINHVLLTIEAAISREISVVSVVLMGQEMPDASTDDNAELIRIHMPYIADFKGIYEFPWLGKGADNPALIANNIIKAQRALDKIFNEVITPYFDSN